MPQPINNRILLENNLAFVDECLAKDTISFAELEAFSKKQGGSVQNLSHFQFG